MKTHELKTDPIPFQAVRDLLKSFEIRFNDRDYQVADKLLLLETEFSAEEMSNGKPLHYTGRVERRTIMHIMRGPIYGLAPDWVIMSIA